MNVIAALFAALGCAVIGWTLGLGVFAAAFEILRARDLDTMLDSPTLLRLFQQTFALIAFGIGLWIFLGRAIWRDAPDDQSRRGTFVMAGLAGLGGAALGHFLDAGGLANGVSKDHYIFIVLASSAALLLAAALIASGAFAPGQPPRNRVGRAVSAVSLSIALVWAALAFDKAIAPAYDRLGDGKTSAWFMLRFPDGTSPIADKKAIKVELRSDNGTTRGFASEWIDQRGRLVLRANVDLKERTRVRTIAVTLPGGPNLLFDLPFPANPRLMNDYGKWHGIDRIAERGEARAARPADDYAIKYMIR